MAKLEIRNLTRRKTPAFAFEKALRAVLPAWDISLAFVEPKEARRLNRALRKRSYAPNVLSYPTGERGGELIICLDVAEKQAPIYGLSYAHFCGLLFIHGLFHLKGMRHGSTMEKAERQVLGRVAPIYSHGSSHSNRHRHRHVSHESRRR